MYSLSCYLISSGKPSANAGVKTLKMIKAMEHEGDNVTYCNYYEGRES